MEAEGLTLDVQDPPPCSRIQGKDLLVNTLSERWGSLLRAWILDIDHRHTGKVAREEIEHVCEFHGIDVKDFWQSFAASGPSKPQDFLALEDLAPEESANLARFTQAVAAASLSFEDAWRLVDSEGLGVVTEDVFLRALAQIGGEVDGALLFKGLDLSAQGKIWRDEFDFVKLLTPGGWPQTAKASEDAHTPAVSSQPEVEEEVERYFLRWVLPCWQPLQDLFVDKNSAEQVNGSKQPSGSERKSRSVAAEDFVRFLQGLRFKADARTLVRLIFQRCEIEDKHRLREGVESITLSQLQSFRRKAEANLLKCFCEALRKTRGTVLRAWRLDLDVRGHGVVQRSDLERACRVVGCGDDAASVWQALRPFGGPQHPLEICDLAPAEAANLYTFTEEVFKLLGYHLNRAWGLLSNGSSAAAEVKSINSEQFQQAYSRLGLTGDAGLIYRGLVSFNKDGSEGKLWKEELDYAWFLTIKAATIRTVPVHHRPHGWEATGSRHAAQLLNSLGFWGEVPRMASLVARLETFGFSASLLDAALQLVACEVPGLRQGLLPSTPGQKQTASKTSPFGMQRRAKSAGAGRRPKQPEWDGSQAIPHPVRAPFSQSIVKKHRQRTDWLMGGAWRDEPGRLPFNPSARYDSDPTPRTLRGYVSDPGQPKTASLAVAEGSDIRSATTVQDESSILESTPSMSAQRVDAATQAGKAVAICIPRDGEGP
mmetsp:Transcript_62044/g.145570  ORF Transcript_62044/g.145570 Transcript_62044/m.145570 type:complete len:711 (+) Transcript_62044:78-2210(+)